MMVWRQFFFFVLFERDIGVFDIGSLIPSYKSFNKRVITTFRRDTKLMIILSKFIKDGG